MTELLPVVIPLLAIDMLNPVLLAAMIYAAGTTRAQTNAWALLAGHTSAYYVAGIAIALGLERATAFLADPGAIAFGLQIALGAALIWAGAAARGGRASESNRPLEDLTPTGALGAGIAINFVGVPFALPYFAALDQLLKADLSAPAALALLLAYNMVYALPFTLVPIATAVLGERSRPVLERINERVSRVADWLMPKVLAIAGLALVADGVWYFRTGAGLF